MTKSERETVWTRVAAAGWDEHDYFGRKVFAELAGRTRTLQLQALSLGVSLDTRGATVLEAASSVITLADPRVPPLLAGRYTASDGNPISGLCAALLTCYRARVGPWVVGRAGDMIKRLADEVEPSPEAILGWLEERLQNGQELPGFGAPFRAVDERLPVIFEKVDEAGHDGPYWRLARRLWEVTEGTFSLAPNVGLPLSALALDLGFRDEQIAWVTLYMLMHTLVANTVEGAGAEDPLLRTLPTTSLDYRGVSRRRSPRSLAADEASD